jgi:hypothetical protein
MFCVGASECVACLIFANDCSLDWNMQQYWCIQVVHKSSYLWVLVWLCNPCFILNLNVSSSICVIFYSSYFVCFTSLKCNYQMMIEVGDDLYIHRSYFRYFGWLFKVYSSTYYECLFGEKKIFGKEKIIISRSLLKS